MAEKVNPIDYNINCIGVLPVVPVYDQNTMTEEQKKSLLEGEKVMDQLLAQELSSQTNIRFVADNDLSDLQVTGGEKAGDIAKLVGRRINCNAILESTIVRYSERVGGNYSVDKPASVAFNMRLIGVETGVILWDAKFDEQQKSVFENLYDWGKAKSRGFTWITAEELLREGISEKLQASPYFAESQPKQTPVRPAPESNI